MARKATKPKPKEPPPRVATGLLAGYTTVSDWLATRAGAFFQTANAIEWFLRVNRAELIEAQAYIPRSGRNGSLVHVERFGNKVAEIFHREARARISANDA